MTLQPPERHTLEIPGGCLALVLHLPDRMDRAPCVVACHGLSASKDSDKYLRLGDALPAAGFALARFDFRGCGESSGVEEETTVGTRVEDAEAVLAFLSGHPRLSGAFGLLGSSMGGFVALHVASRARGRRANGARGGPGVGGGCGSAARGTAGAGGGYPIVTWNAPGDLFDLANEAHQDDKAIGVPFFMELASHAFDTTPAGVPGHLVVHGEADDVVPVEHGAVLHSRAAEPCDFIVIPGADHRITDPEHRRLAIEASVAWFHRFLSSAEIPA